MHYDACDVLISEILCDAMYTLFYGGFRFKYSKKMSTTTIQPETSDIAEILLEIKHRLGYLPENAKNEAGHHISSIYSSATILRSTARSATTQCMICEMWCVLPISTRKARCRARSEFSKTPAGRFIQTPAVLSRSSTQRTNIQSQFFLPTL